MHGPRRAIKSVMLRDNRNFVLLDGGERASRRILDAVTCLDLRVKARHRDGVAVPADFRRAANGGHGEQLASSWL